MKTWSSDLRKIVVEAYKSGRSGSYLETARMFGISAVSVSRWLRQERETGDLEPRPRPGKPRKMDLEWLRSNAEKFPDARLIDRADAWQTHSGQRVSIDTVSTSLRVIGWTYKKNSNGKRAGAPGRKTKTAEV